MKNIMNKVNPLDKIKGLNAMDKIKGMNLNPVTRVKELVTNSKQPSANTSAGQSAQTSRQGTPDLSRREDSQSRTLALPPIEPEDSDVEAQQTKDSSRPGSRQDEAGTSAAPIRLPPITTVKPRGSSKQDDTTVNVKDSNA